MHAVVTKTLLFLALFMIGMMIPDKVAGSHNLKTTLEIPVKYSISGTIRDASNGETLTGATIYVIEEKTGTVTDLYGHYSLTLAEGNYTLSY